MSWVSITGYASELTFDFFSRHLSHALQTLLRVLFSESESVSRCWVPIIWNFDRWRERLVYDRGQVFSQVEMPPGYVRQQLVLLRHNEFGL